MDYSFASRMRKIPESFLNELFRVSLQPGVISFAGGLPNTDLIDLEGIRDATQVVFEEDGREALQYSDTHGFLPLREKIAERYRLRHGMGADAGQIRLVNGSQQCLDLVAKIFLDANDHLGMERPGYLGAIEAFSLYEPEIHQVELEEDGVSIPAFQEFIETFAPKFFYGIPNFQNPSGRSYSEKRRVEVAGIIKESDTIFYEDDAFGELSFDRRPRIPIKKLAPEHTVMSGSFSKIVAPGLRLGWIFAPEEIIRQFDTAKQAADLHSNYLSQKIMNRYMEMSDIDRMIDRVASHNSNNCKLMCDLVDDLLPGVSRTSPEGGMFLWLTLPDKKSSDKLFRSGLDHGVAVLPGIPFFTGDGGENHIRMNFSTSDPEMIKEGMDRLKKAYLSIM